MDVIIFFLVSLGLMLLAIMIEHSFLPWVRNKYPRYRLIDKKYTVRLFDIAPDYNRAQYRDNGDFYIDEVLKYDEDIAHNLLSLTVGLEEEVEDGYDCQE